MPCWTFLTRAARSPVPALATTLLAVAAITAMASEGRVNLAPDVLARSRGTNPNDALIMEPCNLIAGLSSCSSVGATCQTCQTNLFSFAGSVGGSQSPGYLTSPTAQSCGSKMVGTCQADSTCGGLVPGVGNCPNPPNTPVAQ